MAKRPAAPTYTSVVSKHNHENNRTWCLGTFCTETIYPSKTSTSDLQLFLSTVRDDVVHRIKDATVEKGGIKWYLNVTLKMIRHVIDTEIEVCTPHFRSCCSLALPGEDPDVHTAMEKVNSCITSFKSLQ